MYTVGCKLDIVVAIRRNLCDYIKIYSYPLKTFNFKQPYHHYCLQDMENKIRNTLNEIYFGKTKDVVNGLRSTMQLSYMKQRENLQNDLAAALRGRSSQQTN